MKKSILNLTLAVSAMWCSMLQATEYYVDKDNGSMLGKH